MKERVRGMEREGKVKSDGNLRDGKVMGCKGKPKSEGEKGSEK